MTMCIRCGNESEVIDIETDMSTGVVERKRCCKHCGKLYSTFEVHASVARDSLIKKNVEVIESNVSQWCRELRVRARLKERGMTAKKLADIMSMSIDNVYRLARRGRMNQAAVDSHKLRNK